MFYEASHVRTGHLHHEGKYIIIDTAETKTDFFETMAMRPDGKEIETRYAHTLEDAEQDYAYLLREYGSESAQRRFAPALTGKYKKLRDDLKTAYNAVASNAELMNMYDGGTCNFDSPTLTLPRWSGEKVKQAAEEAGGSAWEWNFGGRRFVLSFPFHGQGDRRSACAEAMRDELKKMGYGAGMYYAMD